MKNVIDFPKTKSEKVQKAIDLFTNDTAGLALTEFNKLIDQGYDEAFSFVGNIYECGGKDVECDYEKARFYYEQSLERTGSVAAYLGLIRIYYYGLGIEKDCCKALEYCSILVEEINHPHANFFIGKMYMEGCCVEQNLDQAKEYFMNAWEQGYVFGLTYIALIEQKSGYKFRAWIKRARAGLTAYNIGRKNINDPRIREL